MRKLILLLAPFCCLSVRALAQTPAVPPAEVQIKTAVLAAPADKRDGAMVYGYSDKNEFVVLRQ